MSLFLVLTNISSAEWSYELDAASGKRVIGRSKNAAIAIPGRFHTVSRKHAQVWVDRYGTWIEDLKSSGGTHLNDVFLQPGVPAQLQRGDRLRLGELSLEVVSGVDRPMRRPLASPAASSDADAPETVAEASNLLRLLQHATNPGGDPAPEEDVDTVKLNDLSAENNELLARLTPAEMEVLLCLCRGFTRNEEIAAVLHRSPNTVRTQITRIFEKLEVHSRSGLLGWVKRSNANFAAGELSDDGRTRLP